jgi:AraC-like DNA-binding protein
VPLLPPNLGYMFQVLRLSASVHDGKRWRILHSEPNLIAFETQHGLESDRFRYNERCFRLARRTCEAVVGEHAGLSDLFVPIVAHGKTSAFLTAGPFLTSRPTAVDVLARWRRLTGRQGHPDDPEFSHYLSMTLAALVLEGPRVATFQRFGTLVARLLAGEADGQAVLAQAERLHAQLEQARFVEQIWEAVRTMIDERTSRVWSSPHAAEQRETYGLPRPAEAALVGLTVSTERATDPVEQVLRSDAFQRACVELARRAGDLISGPVGSHGVVFLSSARGSPERKEQRLLDLGERLAAMARRAFGFRLHMGVSTRPASALLCEHYQAALEAAQSALSEGARIVCATPDARRPASALRRQHKELLEIVEQPPGTLPARFDRYLEAVALRCGYRLEPVRAHVESGFERIAEALLDGGALDERAFDDISGELERAARRAATVGELFAAYRRVVADMAAAMQRPSTAHKERRLARAVAYIHRHYAEPLGLAAVSRVAGFAPGYFSRRFKERERITFEGYVARLRIERARHLLASTDLTMGRVAALSGYSSQQYFARVFKRAAGTTPLACRRRMQKVHR